jgi:hypothetical protein
MRVLIRQRSSSRYLAERDSWVAPRERALDFVSSVVALDVATRMDLKNIEIVLDFGNPRSDVILNVPESSKNPPTLS